MEAPECPDCDVSLLEGIVRHPRLERVRVRAWWAPWRTVTRWDCPRCGYRRHNR